MSQESGTEIGLQKAAGRPTQRAAQKWTTTQRAAQSGQQEAAEGPTQETHRHDFPAVRFTDGVQTNSQTVFYNKGQGVI